MGDSKRVGDRNTQKERECDEVHAHPLSIPMDLMSRRIGGGGMGFH